MLANRCSRRLNQMTFAGALRVIISALRFYSHVYAGAGPGFLERGFICIKGWGSFCLFYLVFLKYSMKMKKIGLAQGGGSNDPPEPPSGSATGMHTDTHIVCILAYVIMISTTSENLKYNVAKKAKIRKLYNQVLYLIQHIICKSDKKHKKTQHKRESMKFFIF